MGNTWQGLCEGAQDSSPSVYITAYDILFLLAYHLRPLSGSVSLGVTISESLVRWERQKEHWSGLCPLPWCKLARSGNATFQGQSCFFRLSIFFRYISVGTRLCGRDLGFGPFAFQVREARTHQHQPEYLSHAYCPGSGRPSLLSHARTPKDQTASTCKVNDLWKRVATNHHKLCQTKAAWKVLGV